MGLIDDCELHFATKDLYEVLNVSKDAGDAEIKKGYRKLSLKWHPDRHAEATEDKKAEITSKFQTLSKVHFILSDKDKRSYYDNTGTVLSEDGIEGDADWSDYWRLLFPKITVKDIEGFMAKYIGSEDEKNDLKKAYCQYDGDMNKISESVIGFDEDRTRKMLEEMIEAEELPAFDMFVNEPAKNREVRRKKLEKEHKLAAKESKKKAATPKPDDDLVNAIQNRSKGNFDSMIASLEAKYGASAASPKRKKAPAKATRSKK
jgi:DnaJ family protein C protein 9